jgi:hypothetical protein
LFIKWHLDKIVKLDLCLFTFRINSKWIKALKVRSKAIKVYLKSYSIIKILGKKCEALPIISPKALRKYHLKS